MVPSLYITGGRSGTSPLNGQSPQYPLARKGALMGPFLYPSAFDLYIPTCSSIHFVPTDLGRVIEVPIARLIMSWANIPCALDTLNSTV